MMTSPNLEPIPTKSITVTLPERTVEKLTNMGRLIKKSNGLVFGDPLTMAICTLMETSKAKR